MRIPALLPAFCCLMWFSAQAYPAETGSGAKRAKSPPEPKAGTVLRDCANCPQLVVIPAGRFDMGSPDSEDERNDDEGPVHRVRVAAFALGKTEITRGQFAAFVKQTKYDAGDTCWTLEEGTFRERSHRNWRDPGYLQTAQHPVSCISWNDAQAYAQWLSRKTGKKYRLPTEAEWEYAARGKTLTSRYWGDKPEDACKYASVADQTAQAKIRGAASWLAHACTDGFAYASPVSKFKANAFKLHDMLGNVWEWTADGYHEDYENAPPDGRAWPGEDDKRVIRGGSWNNSPELVRAAKRGRDDADKRFSNIGFRIARELR
ncbi:MAG: formylglycine-generating enzyme family protein [Sideroxyarcus sp.]|nr:formylglycine-generating enzyme family protein [Sideroxyarcus sp.]